MRYLRAVITEKLIHGDLALNLNLIELAHALWERLDNKHVAITSHDVLSRTRNGLGPIVLAACPAHAIHVCAAVDENALVDGRCCHQAYIVVLRAFTHALTRRVLLDRGVIELACHRLFGRIYVSVLIHNLRAKMRRQDCPAPRCSIRAIIDAGVAVGRDEFRVPQMRKIDRGDPLLDQLVALKSEPLNRIMRVAAVRFARQVDRVDDVEFVISEQCAEPVGVLPLGFDLPRRMKKKPVAAYAHRVNNCIVRAAIAAAVVNHETNPMAVYGALFKGAGRLRA